MAEYVPVCAQSALPGPGSVIECTVAGRALCVANLDGEICVLDGTCPHEGGPLGEGSLEQRRVVCPWHGYAFDLRTGDAEDDPDLKAQVLDAKVENGELLVKL
jgi:nitrite reductase/ring-hydroxylating ferredoxin subunit